jgi:hypothetical protein
MVVRNLNNVEAFGLAVNRCGIDVSALPQGLIVASWPSGLEIPLWESPERFVERLTYWCGGEIADYRPV